jgi:hypothetical protein
MTSYTPKENKQRAIVEQTALNLIGKALSEIYVADTEREATAALRFALAESFQQSHPGSAAAAIVRELLPTLAMAMSHPSNFVGSAPGEYLSRLSDEYWPTHEDSTAARGHTAECSCCNTRVLLDIEPTAIKVAGMSALARLCKTCREDVSYSDEKALYVLRCILEKSERTLTMRVPF